MCGTGGSVDENAVNYWKSHLLPRHFKGYSPKDILSTDKTGIFFNLLPQKTLQLEKLATGEKRVRTG
jgi:hypothetical protein